jgi:hypothetical protein
VTVSASALPSSSRSNNIASKLFSAADLEDDAALLKMILAVKASHIGDRNQQQERSNNEKTIVDFSAAGQTQQPSSAVVNEAFKEVDALPSRIREPSYYAYDISNDTSSPLQKSSDILKLDAVWKGGLVVRLWIGTPGTIHFPLFLYTKELKMKKTIHFI